MNYIIDKMNEKYARMIVKWEYDDQYSIYNLRDTEQSITELLCGEYYFACDNQTNELIGFYCFGKAAQVPSGNSFGVYAKHEYIDIGVGLIPDKCGNKLGLNFVLNGIEFAKTKLNFDKFRLTVASFNLRAIKVYKKAGFTEGMCFQRTSDNMDIVEFITMTLE